MNHTYWTNTRRQLPTELNQIKGMIRKWTNTVKIVKPVSWSKEEYSKSTVLQQRAATVAAKL